MRPAARHRRRAALAVGAALALTLASCSSGPPAAPSANEGIVLNEPTPQNIGLIDQHNQPVSLASLRGKDIVMAPFLTLCQDECPLITAAFTSLQRDVRAAGLGHRVVFLDVTVDPTRDTPSRLAAYQAEFGADWLMWTGTPANVAAFWKPFGVSYQTIPEEQPPELDWLTHQPLTYDVAHTDGYILIDAKGHERFVDANAPDIPNLSPKLRALLSDGGLRDLTHPQGPTWTIADALGAIGWLLQTTIPGSAGG
jgi:protein SCO1/2